MGDLCMKQMSFFSKLSLVFVISSAALYSIHYLIFSDAAFIFRYLIAQLGFLPLNVLLVTVVINSLISNRAKNERLQKMNMVIGAFFSDVGTELLKMLSRSDAAADNFAAELTNLNRSSREKDYIGLKSLLGKKNFAIQMEISSLIGLDEFLQSKREYLLRLLENPNLMEHEQFTNLLWAVFHITEELKSRQDLSVLPASDYTHLGGDIERVYRILIYQWLDYMQHLQIHYPHLFSLAVRTNPFDPQAWAEVIED